MLIKVGIGIVLVIAAVLVYVALQPSDFRVTREIKINTSPVTIFPLINNAKAMNSWNPFIKEDPNTKVEFSGAEAGVGATTKWVGGKSGKGTSTVIESIPNSRTVARIDFEKPFAGTNMSEFNIRAEGLQSTVTWSVYGKSTFIPKLICAFFFNMDKMLGGSLEKGLAELKTAAEADALK